MGAFHPIGVERVNRGGICRAPTYPWEAHMRRTLVLAVLAFAVLAPAASAASSPPRSGKLNVDIAITKFGVAKGKTTATGVATATLSDNAGRITRIKQPVALAVKSGGSCRILALVL